MGVAVEASTTVLVYDGSGAIFSLLRTVPWEVALFRANDGALEAGVRKADLAIIAAYERTDWSMAVRLAREVPTVVLSARFDRTKAARALSFGLTGYLDANLPRSALGRALAGALRGEPAYPREVLGRWVRWQRTVSRRLSGDGILTPRQREVVALIARGAADKEIAGALGISTTTAQKHVAHILERLGVPNRAAAVAVLSAARA